MKLMVLIFCLINCVEVISQTKSFYVKRNAYLWQDALDLASGLEKTETKQLCAEILTPYYFPNSIKPVEYRILFDSIKNNPFLVHILPPSSNDKEGNKLIEKLDNSPIGQNSELGRFTSPVVVLDALSGLIQHRIVDELNLAYLNQLRDALEKNATLKIIFPQTIQSLVSLGKSYTFHYRSYLTSLRRSCLEDLNQLPANTSKYVYDQRNSLASSDLKADEYVLMMASLKLLSNIRETPEDLIFNLGNYNYGVPNDKHSKLEHLFKFVALISNRLRTNDPSGPWLSNAAKKRDDLFGKPAAIYAFLGLIYEAEKEQLKGIQLSKGKSVFELMQDTSTIVFVKKMHQVFLVIGELESLFKANQTNIGNGNTGIPYFNLQLIERIFSVLTNGAESLLEKEAQKTLLQEILEVKYGIEQKRYATALIKANTLIKCRINKQCNESDGIKMYAEFFDAIMREDNPDSLVHILSAFAAPVGSYSIKRRAPFSVSLSSFPGAIGGNEKLLGENTMQKNTNKINSFAFTAPFGLALSKAIAVKDTRGGHSITGFFPLVDVAAITAFRFEDGAAELPKITWKNFFAPGAYLIWGIRQSPVSINAGFQYGPELREIEQNKVLELVPSRRAVVGLTLDLHLFNLSHRLPPFQNE